jgi:small subunit ribosomal protein S3
MAIEKHFIQEGVIRSGIESFLRTELNRAGYSGINIQKTPLTTRVILYVEKPPIVIGKKGRRINSLTDTLKNRFGVENPSIDVQKIEKPTLDPNIIARRIAVALERGMNRRRIAYKAVRAVMGSKARGVEVILSGKIVGKGGRSRVEKYSEGYMKKAGDSLKLVSIGATQAYLKAGVIGVTVKIVPPETKFPDQISVLKPGQIEPIPEPEPTKKKAEKKTVKKAAKKKAKPKKEPVKKDKPETVNKEVKEEKTLESAPQAEVKEEKTLESAPQAEVKEEKTPESAPSEEEAPKDEALSPDAGAEHTKAASMNPETAGNTVLEAGK